MGCTFCMQNLTALGYHNMLIGLVWFTFAHGYGSLSSQTLPAELLQSNNSNNGPPLVNCVEYYFVVE